MQMPGRILWCNVPLKVKAISYKSPSSLMSLWLHFTCIIKKVKKHGTAVNLTGSDCKTKNDPRLNRKIVWTVDKELWTTSKKVQAHVRGQGTVETVLLKEKHKKDRREAYLCSRTIPPHCVKEFISFSIRNSTSSLPHGLLPNMGWLASFSSYFTFSFSWNSAMWSKCPCWNRHMKQCHCVTGSYTIVLL